MRLQAGKRQDGVHGRIEEIVFSGKLHVFQTQKPAQMVLEPFWKVFLSYRHLIMRLRLWIIIPTLQNLLHAQVHRHFDH